ncbi:uncharacterized protein KZ484_015838 [Pholidichthys leucotaenia]
MKTVYLVLLFHASLQLQCGKREITTYVGGEFILKCTYDTSMFQFSKKYWCKGDSRHACGILLDSDNVAKTKTSQLIDAVTRGLFVKVTHLQFKAAGVYWVGIDKIYADIMTSVKVVITEAPVSKPTLRPLSFLAGRPTCWGKAVTVRCSSAKGTSIHYAWYQQIQHKAFLIHQSSDLCLHCGTVENDSDYYCTASNDISSEKSDVVSVQVLVPAQSNCIYAVHIHGQPIYDCAERMTTTTSTQTPTLTTSQPMISLSASANQFLQGNQTNYNLLFNWAWYEMHFGIHSSDGCFLHP